MKILEIVFQTIGKYIFENGKKHAFGNFNVSTSILEAKHHYILREMKIKYEGKVSLFSFSSLCILDNGAVHE
jgi:hypothetical protein